MSYKISFISGLAGSLALTILHETLRKTVSSAPRMDKLGEQSLRKILDAEDLPIPSENKQYAITMAGDVIGNAMYYSMVGIQPGRSMLTGTLLGLSAGIGAVALPEKMGLNKQYSNATTKTQILTVLIYLTGGLVAGATERILQKRGTGIMNTKK